MLIINFKCSPLRNITHVLLGNPLEGYAVFADMMIKEMRETK